jgi:predicted PurR-regulated permease PerM
MDEKRLFWLLLCIIAGLYLWQIAWGFLGRFSDIFLILILSWLLAFLLEPVVKKLTQKNLSRLTAAGVVYLFLGIILVVAGIVIIPTVGSQLAVLAGDLPSLIENAPDWLQKFATNTLSNSVAIAQEITTAAINLLLVLVFSFYFLVDRHRITKTLYDLLPDEWEENFQFLEKVINTSFAGFLRVQVLLGVIVGAVTFLVLIILGVNYALTASVLAGVLAIVPVAGPVLSLLPPLLPAMMISFNTGLITIVSLFLLQQIIYNLISPKIIGETLKLHPVLVILSFIIGFKIAGFWGAVFAVPVTSMFAIIIKEFFRHLKKNHD